MSRPFVVDRGYRLSEAPLTIAAVEALYGEVVEGTYPEAADAATDQGDDPHHRVGHDQVEQHQLDDANRRNALAIPALHTY